MVYELKKEYLKNNDFKRFYFIEDLKVVIGFVDWRNYKKLGYDKGYFCFVGDMEFDKKVYDDIFYILNILL